jgi:hypothetical protein
VLPVARNLGSWVQVPWAAAADGIGYVHVTMGRINAAAAGARAGSAARATPPSPASMPVAAASPLTSAPRTAAASVDRVPPASQQGGGTISHIAGVGGMIGSMRSFGATARWWRRDRLGVQVAVTRDAITSSVTDGRVSSTQVEPGVVYALFDRVRDYVWVRPYVGSAISFRHQALKVAVPDSLQPASDNGVGFRVFGGGELTFATATQFGVSAEIGYRRLPSSFDGFEADRLAVAIAGHWYIR